MGSEFYLFLSSKLELSSFVQGTVVSVQQNQMRVQVNWISEIENKYLRTYCSEIFKLITRLKIISKKNMKMIPSLSQFFLQQKKDLDSLMSKFVRKNLFFSFQNNLLSLSDFFKKPAHVYSRENLQNPLKELIFFLNDQQQTFDVEKIRVIFLSYLNVFLSESYVPSESLKKSELFLKRYSEQQKIVTLGLNFGFFNEQEILKIYNKALTDFNKKVFRKAQNP